MRTPFCMSLAACFLHGQSDYSGLASLVHRSHHKVIVPGALNRK